MKTYLDIINNAKKKWECDDLMTLADTSNGKIPFSSPLMNWFTYGGIPRNRLTEFFGDEGGGKSTTAIDICKNAAKLFHDEYIDGLATDEECTCKRVLYVDLEHTFDRQWAKVLGVNDGDIDVMQPPDIPAESILQTVIELIETGDVGLIVLDSIPSFVTAKELEKKLDEKTVAPLAGLMTVFCRKIVPLLVRYQCTMLMINQTRENLECKYIKNTPGGKALKFFESLRIEFRVGKPVDFLGSELPANTEDPAGYIINAQISKQKSAPNDRKRGTYYLMCGSGIRPDFDFALLAINKYGIIVKSGAWFTICDPYTGEVLCNETGKPMKLNGMAKVHAFLQENSEYYDKLKKYIMDDIAGSRRSSTEDENGESEYNEVL